MTDKVALPPPTEPLTLDAGKNPFNYTPQVQQAKKVSEPWYRWFSKVNTALNDATTQLGAAFSGQLAFPATQNASSDANTLDDYEEGTWTPQIEFGDDQTGVTYTSRAGHYTKIGNLVYLSCDVTLSNNGSGSGRCDIANLPFASPDAVSDDTGLFMVVSGGAAVPAAVYGIVGGSNIFLFTQGAAGSANLTEANVTDTGRIRGSIVYQTT